MSIHDEIVEKAREAYDDAYEVEYLAHGTQGNNLVAMRAALDAVLPDLTATERAVGKVEGLTEAARDVGRRQRFRRLQITFGYSRSPISAAILPRASAPSRWQARVLGDSPITITSRAVGGSHSAGSWPSAQISATI